MNSRLNAFSLKFRANAVEWKLLLFLVLFLDVKLLVKLAALVLIYILEPDFKFGFSLRKPRLPLFYPAMIIIGILNFIILRDFSINYLLIVLTGIVFWIACILAIHQVKTLVDKTSTEVLHNTLFLFFMINVVVSLLNLSAIFMEIGFRNPFTYQGQFQKYFMNTGDHIKGISFDSCTTNAVINVMAIVYFLSGRQFTSMLACMVVLLLTGSNMANAVLILAFLYQFLFQSSRDQKSMMVVCLFMLIVFLAKVSPQNNLYVSRMLKEYVLGEKTAEPLANEPIPIRFRPDSLLTSETRKEKIAVLYLDSIERERLNRLPAEEQAVLTNEHSRPLIPGDSIHTATFQSSRDSTQVQRNLHAYMNQLKGGVTNYYHRLGMTPGKMIAFQQALSFMKHHPAALLLGDGVGNFSSKLAFRATGLKMAGGYPQQFVYSNRDFVNNHLDVYAYFFTQPGSSHSVVHTPASVYGQLLTEYGIAGMLAFLILYIGFFLKQWKRLSYGIPLLGVLLGVFFTDYWFEQLSIVVLFECMMFLNIKENTV